jgi:hypothetical protein
MRGQVNKLYAIGEGSEAEFRRDMTIEAIEDKDPPLVWACWLCLWYKYLLKPLFGDSAICPARSRCLEAPTFRDFLWKPPFLELEACKYYAGR